LAKTFEAIKRAKQDELIEKKQRIRIFIEDAVKNADLYVNGDKANIGSKDPASRINEALGKLVNTRYNKLSYMETAPYLADIDAVLRLSNQMSLENYDATAANKLALDDVLGAIELASVRHAKTSLKSLIDRFSVAPYGFIELDVQWLVAMLFKQGKVTFTVNSKNISPIDTDINDMVKYITKREYAEKLLIEKLARATERQIKSVKDAMKDLFSMTAVNDEDDTLIKTFKTRAENKVRDIEKQLIEYRLESRFPGQSVLVEAKDILSEIVDITNPIEFFRYVDSRKDDLLDIEDIAPIITFFEGEQKTIFAKAWKYIDIFENSKTYVVDKQLIDMVESIKSIATKATPYSDIYKLPSLLEQFADLHTSLLEKEAEPIRAEVKIDQKQVMDILNQKDFADKFKDQFVQRFEELKDKLEHSNEVAAVKNIRHESDALRMRCLNEITEHEKILAELYKQKEDKLKKSSKDGSSSFIAVKKRKDISLRYIAMNKIVVIEKETDIDEFLQSIKTSLLKELGDSEDTVINLIM